MKKTNMPKSGGVIASQFKTQFKTKALSRHFDVTITNPDESLSSIRTADMEDKENPLEQLCM